MSGRRDAGKCSVVLQVTVTIWGIFAMSNVGQVRLTH